MRSLWWHVLLALVAPAACTIDEQLVADAYAAGLGTGIIGLALGCTQRRVQQILVALRNDGGLQRATARRTTGLRPCTGIQKRPSGAGVTQHPPHRKASQVAMHLPRHSTRQRVDSLAVPLACTRARARAGECSPRQGACARPRPRERHLSWPAHDHADHRRSDTHTHLIDHAPRAQRVAAEHGDCARWHSAQANNQSERRWPSVGAVGAADPASAAVHTRKKG